MVRRGHGGGGGGGTCTFAYFKYFVYIFKSGEKHITSSSSSTSKLWNGIWNSPKLLCETNTYKYKLKSSSTCFDVTINLFTIKFLIMGKDLHLNG